MLVVFSPIFLVDRKVIFRYKVVASLTNYITTWHRLVATISFDMETARSKDANFKVFNVVIFFIQGQIYKTRQFQ